MVKKDIDNQNNEEMEECNNAFLEILDDLINAISMEKQYHSAGIGMKNNEALLKLRERLQLQDNLLV